MQTIARTVKNLNAGHHVNMVQLPNLSAITQFDDGNVIIDQEKCTGCWACLDVCPFGAITKEAEMAVAFNCDDCKGYDDMACVEACKTSSLHYVEKKTTVTVG